MKVEWIEDPDCREARVTVRSAKGDPEALRALALLGAGEQKITGVREGETFVLERRDVLYADTADRRSFLYTARGVYETPLRLYELEERLGSGFFRASKSALVNFDHIRSLCPDLGGRLRLKLSNGELLVVSRQYAGAIKEKLGL